VIGGLTQQALPHTFSQCLKRKALLARQPNQRVDEVVEAARPAGAYSFLQGSNRDAAASPAHQPHPPDQILVSLTHRVVMNLQAARQFAHAGQRLPGL